MSSAFRFARPVVRSVRQGEPWVALLSLSLSLSVVAPLFAGLFGGAADVSDFRDRSIGPAAIGGVDLTTSAAAYARIFLVLGGCFLVLLVVLGALNGAMRRRVDIEIIARERIGLLLVSEISLAIFVLRLFVDRLELDGLRNGLHLLAMVLLGSMILKAILTSTVRAGAPQVLSTSLLNDASLQLAGLLMAFQLAVSTWIFLGRDFNLDTLVELGFVAVWLVLLGGLLVIWVAAAKLVVRPGRPGSVLALYDLNTGFIVAGAPLMATSLALIVANELQHAWPRLGPRGVALFLIGFMVLMSAGLFVWQQQGRSKPSGARLIYTLYLPLLIASLVTLKFHQQTMELGELDYYGIGQEALPTQQFAQFGSIPLVDLQPIHALSDVVVPSLYTALNGLRGLDLLSWNGWLPELVATLLIYGVLAMVTAPIYAALVTIFLPVRALATAPLAALLMPALVLAWALRRPSVKRFVVAWLAAAGLVLWRPDLGIASILALAVVLIAFLWTEGDRASRISALVALGLVAVLIPVALLAGELLGRTNMLVSIKTLLASYQTGPDEAMVRQSQVSAKLSGLSVYHLLPTVGLICVVSFVVRKIVLPVKFPVRGYVVLELALASMFMITLSWRGLSIAETLQPLLFLLVVAILPYCLDDTRWHPRRMARRAWLLAVVVVSVLLGLGDRGHLGDDFEGFHLFRQEGSFALRAWQAGEARVFFDADRHEALLQFFDQELEPDQTFLDFTYSPLLHVLAERRFPTRSIPDIRSISDTSQLQVLPELQLLHDSGLLPVVLFKQGDPSWDSPAGIPNEVGSYRIAEFIYQRYRPYARVGEYEVWRDVRIRLPRRPQRPARALAAEGMAQKFLLGKLPWVWARFDAAEAVRRTEVLAALIDSPVQLRPDEPLSLKVKPGSRRAGYLHIRARPLPASSPIELGRGSARADIWYGAPRPSLFRFDLVEPDLQSASEDQQAALELLPVTTEHHMRRIGDLGRLIYNPRGPDPFVQSFVDLSSAPVADEDCELWVRVHYRATHAGQYQIFFALKRHGFSEQQSFWIQGEATGLDGEPAVLEGPVVTANQSYRLRDLRVDPPREGTFEIVGVEVIRKPRDFEDYLIRLTSQWRWSQGDVERLSLRANIPLQVQQVLLRAAD